MNFISFSFLFFVAVTFALFAVWPRARAQILLAASALFILSWDWRFLVLHVFVSLTAFVAARKMASSPARRKLWLWWTVATYAGVLFYFKYLHFFQSEMAPVSLRSVAQVIWPIGLSFYTLQALGYVIDVFRGKQKPERRFDNFLLFTSFFPQALIGPIERFGRVMPQLKALRPTQPMFIDGCYLIAFGLFKKLVIADRLGVLTRIEGSTLAELQGAQLLVFCLLCYFETYCDFSGYTDLARGIAKLFGVDLMENFDRPYLAQSPADNWARWHISLVTWVRDYIYWPLLLKTKNIYLTIGVLMLSIGLWHAPTLNFLLWSTYWMLIYFVYLLWRQHARPLPAGSKFFLIPLMLTVSSVSTLMLFSNTLEQAGHYLWALVRTNDRPWGQLFAGLSPLEVALAGIALVMMFMLEAQRKMDRRYAALIAWLLIFLVGTFGQTENFAFIYMRF